MFNTTNTLPEKTRTQIVGLLQERLSDAIDLMTQTKQAHWNVKGQNFIALHKFFDELNDGSREFVDLIAERIVQLGGVAQGTIQAAVRHSKLPEYPLTASSGKDHISALTKSFSSFGSIIRKSILNAAEVQDPVTADILTKIGDDVDKDLWMIEAHAQSIHS